MKLKSFCILIELEFLPTQIHPVTWQNFSQIHHNNFCQISKHGKSIPFTVWSPIFYLTNSLQNIRNVHSALYLFCLETHLTRYEIQKPDLVFLIWSTMSPTLSWTIGYTCKNGLNFALTHHVTTERKNKILQFHFLLLIFLYSLNIITKSLFSWVDFQNWKHMEYFCNIFNVKWKFCIFTVIIHFIVGSKHLYN